MKLIILQEKLKEGLNLTGRICSKLTTLPILGNILFKTEKNFLILSATDLEVGIKWRALTKVEEEGEVVLPSQTTSSLVSLFPNKSIKINSKNLQVSFECDNYQSSFKSLNPEEFPIIPLNIEGEYLKFSARNFCQGLSQVVGLASPSTAKPEISGVYFLFQDNLIKIVATDSFRLGEKTIYLEKKEGTVKSRSLILPQKAARELINIFGELAGDLKIYFSPNQIVFESQMEEANAPQVQFVSRLIEGEFPNYQEIIPKKSETQVSLSGKELLNQAKSASVFSGKNNEIKIEVNVKKGTVEISSQSPDVGEYRSQISAKIKGGDVQVSFNHRFLIDGLLNISSEKEKEVILELAGQEGPAVLKPAGDQSYLYILMPIKKD
jgi:DNA polymerase III subunit beta